MFNVQIAGWQPNPLEGLEKAISENVVSFKIEEESLELIALPSSKHGSSHNIFKCKFLTNYFGRNCKRDTKKELLDNQPVSSPQDIIRVLKRIYEPILRGETTYHPGIVSAEFNIGQMSPGHDNSYKIYVGGCAPSQQHVFAVNPNNEPLDHPLDSWRVDAHMPDYAIISFQRLKLIEQASASIVANFSYAIPRKTLFSRLD